MIHFQDLLSADRILFLPPSSKEDALYALVQRLFLLGIIRDKEEFYNALLQREKLMSTSIGLGAALPHAKMASIDHFFLAIGIIKEGIDWNVDDEIPIKFIFMIGGPESNPIDYLSLLSSLTKTIRKEKVLKKLSKATKEEMIISALSE